MLGVPQYVHVMLVSSKTSRCVNHVCFRIFMPTTRPILANIFGFRLKCFWVSSAHSQNKLCPLPNQKREHIPFFQEWEHTPFFQEWFLRSLVSAWTQVLRATKSFSCWKAHSKHASAKFACEWVNVSLTQSINVFSSAKSPRFHLFDVVVVGLPMGVSMSQSCLG